MSRKKKRPRSTPGPFARLPRRSVFSNGLVALVVTGDEDEWHKELDAYLAEVYRNLPPEKRAEIDRRRAERRRKKGD